MLIIGTYLGYITDIAISLAILENIVFEGDRSTFAQLALSSIFILTIFSFVTHRSIRPSLISAALVSILLVFQVAISVSEFWHETLITSSACLLDYQDLIGLFMLAMLLLIEIVVRSKSILDHCVKLLIYTLGLSISAMQIYSVSTSTPASTAKLFCHHRDIQYSWLVVLVLLLPLILSLLSIATRKFDSASSKKQIFPRILLTLVVFVLCAASSQAWQKANSTQKVTLDKQENEAAVPINILLPVLIAEDPIFFKHYGLDYSRLQEAIRESLESGHFKRGGSTISMQLFKVLHLDYEKTLWRKLVQILGALLLEHRATKIDIINQYLNSVSFGPGIIGIENASQQYFQCSTQNLTKEQALKLVLSIYDPILYNPSVAKMPRDAQVRAVVIKTRIEELGPALIHQIKQGLAGSHSGNQGS